MTGSLISAKSCDHCDQSDNPDETEVKHVLSQVYGFIIGGWPTVVDPTFAPFRSKRDELTT